MISQNTFYYIMIILCIGFCTFITNSNIDGQADKIIKIIELQNSQNSQEHNCSCIK